MRRSTSRPPKRGFMLMEVLLSLFIFAIIATSFTRGINALWRGNTYMKEKLVVTQIMDSALHETLYLQRLEEGSSEIFIEERDISLEIVVVPLELENIDGNILQQMWQVTIIARFDQDGIEQERTVQGWRYLPLYR